MALRQLGYIVARCVERNAAVAQRVGMDARVYCAREHSHEVPTAGLSAGGFFECAPRQETTRAFGITLRNPSAYILTGVQVSIWLKASHLTLVSRQGNAWILPGQEDHVWVRFGRDISCLEAINPGENWTWTSWRVDGVKAELR